MSDFIERAKNIFDKTKKMNVEELSNDSEALSKGVDAHQTGKYYEAEKFYRFVLSSNPENPDANHNLGSLSIIFNKID